MTGTEIKNLVDFLLPYETVIVYHGLFKNVLMQEAVLSNLSGDTADGADELISEREVIFEPGILQILEVFETEIFYGLFLQVVYESQLAKFSSEWLRLRVHQKISKNH